MDAALEERVENLLAAMSLEEKAALTPGSDAWHGRASCVPPLWKAKEGIVRGPRTLA